MTQMTAILSYIGVDEVSASAACDDASQGRRSFSAVILLRLLDVALICECFDPCSIYGYRSLPI